MDRPITYLSLIFRTVFSCIICFRNQGERQQYRGDQKQIVAAGIAQVEQELAAAGDEVAHAITIAAKAEREAELDLNKLGLHLDTFNIHPGGGRVYDCLRKNRAKLLPSCRQAMPKFEAEYLRNIRVIETYPRVVWKVLGLPCLLFFYLLF